MLAAGFGLTMRATDALLQPSPDLKITSCDAAAFPEALPAVKLYLPSAPATTDVPIVLSSEPASFIIQLPDANAADGALPTVKISWRTSPEQSLVKATPSKIETDGVGLTVMARGALTQFHDLKLICCDTAAAPLTAPAVKLYLPPVPATTDVPIVLLFSEPASFIIQLPVANAADGTLPTVKISWRTSPEQRSVKTTPSESKIVGFGSTVMTRGALVQSPDLKITSCDAAALPEALPAVNVYLPSAPATTDVPIVLSSEPASFIIQRPDANAADGALPTVKISGRTSPEQSLVKAPPSKIETDGIGLTVMARGALAQFPDLKLIS